MKSTRKIPRTISGYLILPIALPPLPSLPVAATHYLYVRTHEPKILDPSSQRSLFLVNIPFDSTDAHIRTLFSTQLGLPSGRVEQIQVGSTEKKPVISEPLAKTSPKLSSKKRKRDADSEFSPGLDQAQFPSTWDQILLPSGSHAVVIFVDRASMEAALTAVKKARKSTTQIQWGDGIQSTTFALGSKRKISLSTLSIVTDLVQAILRTSASPILPKYPYLQYQRLYDRLC